MVPFQAAAGSNRGSINGRVCRAQLEDLSFVVSTPPDILEGLAEQVDVRVELFLFEEVADDVDKFLELGEDCWDELFEACVSEEFVW